MSTQVRSSISVDQSCMVIWFINRAVVEMHDSGPGSIFYICLCYDVLSVPCSPVITCCTLVNVYVDLLVFTRIAGTSYTGSGRYWC